MTKAGPARKGGLAKSLPMLNRGLKAAGMGSIVFKGEMTVRCELPSVHLDASAWKALMRHYLRRLGLPRATLGLLICGDARSRSLNRLWRRKDKATDVLSFPLQEGRVKPGYRGQLGDLALNLPYTRRSLGRFAPTLHAEAAFLVLHGILHLCGQHHDSPRQEARMWRMSRQLYPPPPALMRRLAIKA
jgi:probable rRNA maturation factor